MAQNFRAWLNRKHKDMIDNIMFRQQPYDINEIPLPWVPSNPTVPSNYKPKIHWSLLVENSATVRDIF